MVKDAKTAMVSRKTKEEVRSKTLALSIIGATALLCACQKTDSIHQYKSTDTQGWNAEDTIVFSIPSLSDSCQHRLSIETRLTKQYEYSNLWLVVEQSYSNDSTTYRTITDTITLDVATKDGLFTGKGRDLLEYAKDIKIIKPRNEVTKGEIRIHHIMDERSIVGVHDIGIKLLPQQ